MSSVRHDWYQTDQRVVIDVLVKNANRRNISVDIQPTHVLIRGDDIEMDLDLAHEIDTPKSTFKIMTVKIEIILQKLVGERWSSLMKKDAAVGAAATAKPFTILPHQESAKKNDKNWDRVVKDVYEKEEIDKVCVKAELYTQNKNKNILNQPNESKK